MAGMLLWLSQKELSVPNCRPEWPIDSFHTVEAVFQSSRSASLSCIGLTHSAATPGQWCSIRRETGWRAWLAVRSCKFLDSFIIKLLCRERVVGECANLVAHLVCIQFIVNLWIIECNDGSHQKLMRWKKTPCAGVLFCTSSIFQCGQSGNRSPEVQTPFCARRFANDLPVVRVRVS